MNSTQTKKLNGLLTIFGNLSFDCGAWKDADDSPADTYYALSDQTEKARANIIAFFTEMCDVPRS